MSLSSLERKCFRQQVEDRLQWKEAAGKKTDVSAIAIHQAKEERIGLPGSPVVKPLCFHCRGPKFNPWSRELRYYMPHGQIKRRKSPDSQTLA